MDRSPSQNPHVLRAFGDPAVDLALAEWLQANDLELAEPELLDTGRSGGKLVSAFVRELDHRRTGGMRVIKLVAPTPDAQPEPRNHGAALRSRVPGNEAFIDRHLVRLAEKAWKLGDCWVMFQHPAGDGKDETRTLAALGRSGRLPRLAAQIVKGVLSGWNPQDPAFDTELTAARFVRELLGARVDEDSPLRTWVRAHVDAEADERVWFAPAEGAPALPNPLALSGGSPLNGRPVRFAARGRGHGDLHPGNIMVPVRADAPPEDYWLIDLSRFSEHALLARDPVHLLLCLIADAYLPHLSEAARAELLAALTDTGPECESRCEGPLIPQGLAELVVRVRTELIGWAAGRGVGRVWRLQWFLALQACALMFTARDRYPDRDRSWFFFLAAHACGAYLDCVDVERPRSAEVPTPGGAPHRTGQEEETAPALPVVVGQVGPAPSDPAPESPAISAPALPAAVRRTEPAPGVPAPASPPDAARRPAEDAGAVPAVLTDIWSTFERPAQQVSDTAFGHLKSDVVLFVQRRATQLRLELSRVQIQSATALPAGAAGLGRVQDLLHDVAAAAKPLHQFLVNPVLRMQTLAARQNPRQQEHLANALMNLLDEVRRAILDLSAPAP
ncbi:hypothetical protein N4P33_20615 [Streptomyces sp. 15-116A]|uniref:hypothetical protein n=1 Tax=Streptomyces sp. 15-116A TaxID=2259035 RepID=UPI0021B2B9AB|nr:hypothetical protein [Streptomyces sp. 15-116A]MCT7354541.1 hypothetical protein [Streptomyces sp. 15-116A]